VNHITGLDRHQVLLFPDSMDDYVSAENPVRFLDAFVGSLNHHNLGFAKAQTAATGRPPFNPADLLRLYLYGYLHRIRSSRALERECHRNVELIWLMRTLKPDFKTIADFRKDNLQPLRAVHRQFLVLCHKLKLFGGQLVAIDGSKFAAVNSRAANFNEGKLKELIAYADSRLAEYFQELEQADKVEAPEPALSRAELEKKIAALKERQDWHKELLAELSAGETKQISTTDEDTRRMPTTGGNVIGYNAQVAVDAKEKLIIADDVTNEVNDLRQLSTIAAQAKENASVQQLEVVADKGYYNSAEVTACVDKNITPYIAKAETSANPAMGLFGKRDFTYDANKDVYLCPAGTELTYRFNTYELGRELRYYRASNCATCPIKSRCTRNKGNRTITREEGEEVMEAMAARVKAQPEKMKLRKQLAEHPFGTIKRWFGYTHFLLKGLPKVRCEWSLITLAYNLKRVLKLVSFQNLIAAVS
jgi:transposase